MERNGDYVEKWCHCVPYVFNKLWVKKYLRFSFDWPLYNGSVYCICEQHTGRTAQLCFSFKLITAFCVWVLLKIMSCL
jgi:hypothetical protein